MSTTYRYFALLTPTHPTLTSPSIVCRQWTDASGRVHEEEYTQDLRWRPSNTEQQVLRAELDGEIRPITEEAALRFVEETQPARVRSYEPADGQYFYSVIVTNLNPLENPRALLRTWLSPQGYSMEQAWTHTTGWVNSSYMYDLHYDHLDGDAVGITEEEVPRYQEIAEKNYLEATRVINYRYYAIVDESHPVDDPLTMVRQWNDGDVVKEEQLTDELLWEPADLVGPRGDRAVPLDADTAAKIEYVLVKRFRAKHGL
ncbi:hypothetical protein [Lentzea sp. NPDC051838]|uniref:hypothetical protein n=1 Tax=Lentzea sp. NPDC051838 TaxID=3154849 RepID=UPI0034449DFB